MDSQKEEIFQASDDEGNKIEEESNNVNNENENQKENDDRVLEEEVEEVGEDDQQDNGEDQESKNESNSQSDQGRIDRENEDDEEQEDGQSSNQPISSQGESNQGSRQEDGGLESGSGGRRLSSRKRNKKQISDMDFSYKPKVVGSVPAVKKNKKDQKTRQQYVFENGHHHSHSSVGSKPKKIEVIEVPVVEVSVVDLAKEREEKKKQEKLLRKEAERLEKIQKQFEREEKEKQRKAEKLLKEQQLLEEQQYKREKKEQQQQLSVVKKNVNKRIFNPQEYNQALTKKIQIETELKEIFRNFGAKQDKYPEPEQVNSRWEYILQEIQDTAEYFQKRRSYFQFQTKKIAKHSLTALSNLKQSKEQKIKEEAKRIRKIAETCNQMVQRFFWRGMHKVKKFMKVMEYQQEQKEDQQKRLESLVSDQLNLSSKLAKLLQIAKEIPELDTQKAVEESKAKSIASERTEEQKIQEEQLRVEKATAAAEKEAEKRRKKEEELEQAIIENEELAEKYDISIELSRDSNNNYLFSKMVYTKKPNESGEPADEIDIEEEQEIEDELDAYGNIKLPFHDFEPQVVSLNDQTIIQPFLLKGRLREYQLIGQNWLATLQQKKMNGILADEMGLGKTIQTISMLAHLACNKGVWGPHLIIVPTSILINWEIEFKKWCPAFKIMTYYGSPKERKLKRTGWSKMNHFHVCITSYKMALQDQKIFRRKKWYFMVLDEAQHIKNFKSQRWQVLLNFHTKHRLLLTGTPLQNDVGELWSLLHFLMPRIFDSHADFMEWFSIPMQQALQKNLPISQEILTKLHSILRPFLLRRLKRDVERQLPTKTEYIVKCTLSRRQKYLYDEFISRDDTKKSMHQQDFLGLMNIVMQLKKVCNHPDLFEARTIESPFQSARLRIVVFSHFLLSTKCNISEKFLFIYNEMSSSSYELAKAKTLMPVADDFYEMNNLLLSQENWPEFIPHFAQRWKILSQFTKQQSLKRTFKINRQRIQSENVIYGADTIQFLTFQSKSNPYQELSEFQTLTFEQTLDSVRMLIKEFSFSQRAIAETPQMVITPFDSEKSNYYHRFNQEAQKPLNYLARQFHYCNIRRILCFPSKKLLMYDCGKLNTMIQLLKKLKSRGDKVLIFTQMSRMLDIFENVLNLFNFTYVRLDGSTKIENRQKVVERFNGDPRIFCFISSTRSGGIGLNLTGANVVLFYDTDWNPAMDRQAQDRCHRIGQTRNVSIYRLISEYTIEENILLKSIQKRKLDEYIMEEGKFNTQFYEKFDVRGILGGMLGESKKQIEDEKLDKQQIEKVLENVEDKEDAAALKKAQMEEIEFVTEGAAEVADMDKDEEAQKEKAFSVDPSKFPKIFQYCIRFIKNEEELHLNDGEKDMEDEDDMSEDEEEDNENEIEDGSKSKIVVEEEDEEFKYVSEDKRDDEDEEEEKKKKKQIDNQDDNEEGINSNDENENTENNRSPKNTIEENHNRNGLVKENGNENSSPKAKEESYNVNGNSNKYLKEDQDAVTTNVNDENSMQEEEKQAAPQQATTIDKEDDEEDMAGLKKNGLFSKVLMEEDRGGEEGRRLTRTALRKSAKVQARKQLEDMLQRIQEEQEKETNNNTNSQNGTSSSNAKDTPGKPKKKVTFLDEVLLQQQQVEKQQKDQLKKAKQQQSKVSQGLGGDPQDEQVHKSGKQEDGEEDDMNIEQEEIDEEEDQDQEQDQEIEDIEEEDKFNDEDRKNSIKIYKKHFLFVKKNYFV